MEKEMLKVIYDLCEGRISDIQSNEGVKSEYTQGFLDGAATGYRLIAAYIKTTLAETDV